MIDTIGNALLKSNATSVEEAKEVETSEGTIGELIVEKTAKIGEKLSLRRFEILTKNNDEHFGAYIHMGGKIAALTLVKGASEDVAKDVVDTLEPIAQDKEVTLTVEGAAPDILANDDRLKQALINLVDNAIRHVEVGGHVRIMLSGINDTSVVAVKDDGCGIGDIDPVLLFKRFYRRRFITRTQ